MSKLYKNKNYESGKLKGIFAVVCLMRREELKLEKLALKEIKIKKLNKNKWGNIDEIDKIFEKLVNLKNMNSKHKSDLYDELINIKIPNKKEIISNEFNTYVKSKQGRSCQDAFWSKRNQDRTYDNLVNYLRLGKKRYINNNNI